MNSRPIESQPAELNKVLYGLESFKFDLTEK